MLWVRGLAPVHVAASSPGRYSVTTRGVDGFLEGPAKHVPGAVGALCDGLTTGYNHLLYGGWRGEAEWGSVSHLVERLGEIFHAHEVRFCTCLLV